MKKIYLIIICIGLIGIAGSCSGHASKNDGERIEESKGGSYKDFSDVEFDSQASVMGFMSGKTFSDGTTDLRLSGNNIEMSDYSGRQYGTITEVRVIGSNKAKIVAQFPRLSSSVTFGLIVDDHEAYIIDSMTHTTFDLQ